MRTRDYRRHMWSKKLRRRAKLFASWRWLGTSTNEFWEAVKAGKCSWIRTTGRPCNCYDCTYRKYKRLSQSELKKIIYGEIQCTKR